MNNKANEAKSLYTSPAMELVALSMQDILTSSNDGEWDVN